MAGSMRGMGKTGVVLLAVALLGCTETRYVVAPCPQAPSAYRPVGVSVRPADGVEPVGRNPLAEPAPIYVVTPVPEQPAEGAPPPEVCRGAGVCPAGSRECGEYCAACFAECATVRPSLIPGEPNWREPQTYGPTPSGGGPVHVRGYHRRDGTYVRPHTRSRPRRR